MVRDWTWLRELPRSPRRGLARLRDDGRPFDGLVALVLASVAWCVPVLVGTARLARAMEEVPVGDLLAGAALLSGLTALSAAVGFAALVLPLTTLLGRAMADDPTRPRFKDDYVDVLTLYGVGVGLPGLVGGVLATIAVLALPGRSLWLPVLGLTGLAAAWLAALAGKEVFGLSTLLAVVLLLLTAVGSGLAVVVMMVVTPFAFSPLVVIAAIYFLRGPIADLFRAKEQGQRVARRLESQAVNPHDARARLEMGAMKLDRGRAKEATALAEEALEIEEGYLAARYLLGRALLADGRPSEAAEHLERVHREDPKHARGEVRRELGKAYLEAGRPADAKELLAAFTRSNASDSQSRFLLGRALHELGDDGAARGALEEAIDLGRTVPDFKKRENRPWAGRARALLKALGG